MQPGTPGATCRKIHCLLSLVCVLVRNCVVMVCQLIEAPTLLSWLGRDNQGRGQWREDYLVRWKGYTSAADCWVRKADLLRDKAARGAMEVYELELKIYPSLHSRGSLEGLSIMEESI